MVVGSDINEITTSIPLFVPNLGEIAPLLSNFLKQNFAKVNVEVVTCPDLTKSPFSLTGPHLADDLVVIDVGGPGNLFPDVRVDKTFDSKKIAKNALPEATKPWIFGPGAGPRHVVGVNCETVLDSAFGDDKDEVRNHTTKISYENGLSPALKTVDSSDFCLMANLGVTDTAKPPGKMLKIEAKERIGELNFAEAVRQFFVQEYPEKDVSLAGVFAIKEGSIKVHVMPDFPETLKFEDRDKFLNSWLHYFDISSR
uniref:DUF1907 domain-containing protein n=1 Tax=Panagrellus redivivus TaxID=6233 RepID=A0A7E4VHC4_PANRE